jgi:hypothetical protein
VSGRGFDKKLIWTSRFIFRYQRILKIVKDWKMLGKLILPMYPLTEIKNDTLHRFASLNDRELGTTSSYAPFSKYSSA